MPEQSGNDTPRPQLVVSGDESIVQIAYLSDGRVVTESRSGVRVWNLQSGEQEASIEHEDEIVSFAVTQDGAKIIISDYGGGIKVWDAESHQLVKVWTHKEQPAIAISPDDQLIAAGGRTVGIYTTEGERVKSIEVRGGVRSLCFSPDGNKLACGTFDDIHIYDVETGTLVLGPLEGHDDAVTDVLWSRDGRRLFSTSLDETIRCWNSGRENKLDNRGHVTPTG